jgi:ABC-type phosphate transport system substrate-binding protein
MMQARRAVPALLFAALALAGGAAAAQAQTRTLVAIVNRERPERGLTRAELVQISRGEIRYWPSSRQPIQFALPPGSPEARDAFIRKVLHTTPTEFDREWRAKRFRGESALIPNPDLSRSEVMQAVQTQRHFIAIVELDWLRSIDARFMENVKILAIDGKAPDDAGYPLLVSTGAAREAWWAEAARSGRRIGGAARAAEPIP